MSKLQLIIKSALAGFFIGIAGVVFVLVKNALPEPYGLIVGSCLFSVGLISVILLEAYLFTGKVGYINSGSTLVNALIGLVINLVVAFLIGLIYRLIMGTETIMDAKIAIPWHQVLFKGIITGVLIYLAVELYKHVKNIIVIILPVMAFILSGSLHCIAEATYIGMCELNVKEILYIILVILGNSIGSLLTRLIQVLGEKLNNKKPEA